MADGFSLLDGSQIRKALPDLQARASKKFAELTVDGKGVLTGEQARAAAEAEAAALLLGAQLSTRRLDKVFQGIATSGDELDEEAFGATVEKYVHAIADALEEEPVAVSVVDGSVMRKLLEDEDEFAMLAENLFTVLDADENGKLNRSEIRPALLQLGAEMGVPAPSAKPEVESLLTDVFKKYGTGEDEELGQTQFAKMLQEILQDLADSLKAKPIVVVHDFQVINGSRLRKVLADEKLLEETTGTIFKDLDVDGNGKLDKVEIRPIFESKGIDWGLPPLKTNETVLQLYDNVFNAVDADNSGQVDRSEFQVLVKTIFEHFAAQLEANPIVVDTETAYQPE